MVDIASDPFLTLTLLLYLQGGRFFGGHWFYKMVDTALAVNGEDLWAAMPPKRIFRASTSDNTKGDYTTTYPFAVIARYTATPLLV